MKGSLSFFIFPYMLDHLEGFLYTRRKKSDKTQLFDVHC